MGWVVIVMFFAWNSVNIWMFSNGFNIFENGEASLDSFFFIAPIMLMIFAPAMTMKSIADEKRQGTIELLLTKPLSDMQIILAKYFAALTLAILSLIPTLIFYYSVYQLGDPVGNIDTGGTTGAYFGLFLVSAAFVAIGLFCSACSRNQAIAYLFGIALCFFFFYGFELIGTYNAFGSWDAVILKLGVWEHFSSLRRGVIDSRDVLYFISLAATFIVLTRLVLQSRKW